MKKRLLYISICLLFSGFSYGQTIHTSPDAVKNAPVLIKLSDQIKAKETAVSTTSRNGAEALAADLTDLYAKYSVAITEQINNTKSQTELKELNQELRYVEKRKAELSSTNR